MSDRLILGLDNSMDFLNLALGTEDRLIEERHSSAERHSSEMLPVRVSRLLADHGVSAADLSALVVTLGPGSFTGVRVALAFCKGLVAGLAIPLFGIPTPDVLALTLRLHGRLLPLPAYRREERARSFLPFTGSRTAQSIRVDGFHALKPDNVAESIPAPCLCFGTGVGLCASALAGIDGLRMIDGRFQRVSGEALLRAGRAAQARGHHEEAKPIYGRRSEAEIKFNVNIP